MRAGETVDDAAVYAVHARRLVALATALAGPASAEDVVSSAMARVLASPGWATVEDHGAYLTRAVGDEGRSAHRSSLRREARERRAAASRADVEPADPVPEIMRALAALPLRQRAVTFL